MIYPDGEVLTYDSGGLAPKISGQKQAIAYPYMTFMGYDTFEARERVAYGNGTSSDYAYNPLNRRLTNLAARTKSARTMMDMSYGYDAVGNVKTLANTAALPAAQSYLKGGASSFTFGYDDLYQLTAATGAFDKPNNPTQKFTDGFSYDSIHNMIRKTQRTFSQLANETQLPNAAFTYDWTYAYASSQPHAATHAATHAYLYDANGNQAGWNDLNTPQTRRISWDEENRMQQVNDNGALTQFKYDDTSNRIVKRGGVGLETVYVNAWHTAGPGQNQKHVFAGATRIVSKLEMPPTGSGTGTGASNLPRWISISITRIISARPGTSPGSTARCISTWSTSRSASSGSTRSSTTRGCGIDSPARSGMARPGCITSGRGIGCDTPNSFSGKRG